MSLHALLTDFYCEYCGSYLGTIDATRVDIFEQQNRLFFSGLGRFNLYRHTRACPLRWNHLNSTSFKVARREPDELPDSVALEDVFNAWEWM
jgi:hypothetical protein